MGFGGGLRSLVVKERRECGVSVLLLVCKVTSRISDIQFNERLERKAFDEQRN
jgi:hypothetical protein